MLKGNGLRECKRFEEKYKYTEKNSGLVKKTHFTLILVN